MKNYLISIFLFFALQCFAQDGKSLTFGSEIEDSVSSADSQLPAVFDLRKTGRLSPVKTQPDGGCWATATMSSVESVFRTFGYGKYELSDINLKLFNGFDSTRNTNGNYYMATAYFSRGAGPLLKNPETDSLYLIAPKTAAYITDARFLPDEPVLIKKTIMNIGAVYSMIHFKKSDFDTVYNILNTESERINHVVNIVGWNDTMRVKSGKGVWIAQNSLGEKFGEKGFFYIPYTDPNILKYTAIWNRWIPYDSSAMIYYYDTLGSYNSYGYNDSLIYGLVKYTAQADCKILKIGTWVNHKKTRFYSAVYKNFDRATGALTEKSAVIAEKSCKYPGYYTFDLSEPVEIKKGEEFYLLVRYIASGESMPMPVEQYIEGYCDPVLTSGKCFINHDIDKWPSAWYETGENAKYDFLRFNLCVKAYGVRLFR